MTVTSVHRTAMILAAGLGTRLKPLTDTMPKALVCYRGVPMIELLMRKLRESGFRRVVINVHHFADMIENFVRANGGFGMDVLFSDERDMLLDTGGGIRHAAGMLDGPALIHNVDIISDIDLAAFHDSASAHGISDRNFAADLLVSCRKSSRYLLADRDGMLKGWTCPEKGQFKGTGSGMPDAEEAGRFIPYAFSGIHFISGTALKMMESWPEKFSIIDFYLQAAGTNTVRCVPTHEGSSITDIGKPDMLK